MGFLDKLKGTAKEVQEKAKEVKEKAVETIDEKSPQIKGGINKAGEFVDKKTKGKYSDKIAKGTQQAGAAVDKIKAEDAGPEGTTPPKTTPPSTDGPTTPPAPHTP
jgi:antitoxin protein of toxin-antitoxin system